VATYTKNFCIMINLRVFYYTSLQSHLGSS